MAFDFIQSKVPNVTTLPLGRRVPSTQTRGSNLRLPAPHLHLGICYGSANEPSLLGGMSHVSRSAKPPDFQLAERLRYAASCTTHLVLAIRARRRWPPWGSRAGPRIERRSRRRLRLRKLRGSGTAGTGYWRSCPSRSSFISARIAEGTVEPMTTYLDRERRHQVCRNRTP